MQLAFHPVSEIFPLMSDEEIATLAADIRENGLREPLWVHSDGRLIDGRNRYLACQKIGKKPTSKVWDGKDTQLVGFVVSLNLHRRHLDESQRAVVGAKIAKLSTGLHQVGINADHLTQPQAAALLNVSDRTIRAAKTVLTHGTRDEIAAVESGEAKVTPVARQILDKMPKRTRVEGARPRTKKPSLADAGGNPERIQRQQINAEIWGRVRDALTHLTSLPAPAEVVAIVRAKDRTGLVEARLSQAVTWLQEFSDVWSNRDQA